MSYNPKINYSFLVTKLLDSEEYLGLQTSFYILYLLLVSARIAFGV